MDPRIPGPLRRSRSGPPPPKRNRPALAGTSNRAADRIGSSNDLEDKHPPAGVQGKTCTATLRQIAPTEAEGVLLGHPGLPTVRTHRAGDVLHVRILLRERTLGGGSLMLDVTEEPATWAGEIHIDGATWWATSAAGSGILEFCCPRRRRREDQR